MGEDIDSGYEGIIDEIGTKYSKEDVRHEQLVQATDSSFSQNFIIRFSFIWVLQVMSKCGHGWDGMRKEVVA